MGLPGRHQLRPAGSSSNRRLNPPLSTVPTGSVSSSSGHVIVWPTITFPLLIVIFNDDHLSGGITSQATSGYAVRYSLLYLSTCLRYYRTMTKIVTVMNLKGGTAKTTTACFLGHAYAAKGLSVILVDADPQKSLQEWAGQADFDIPTINMSVTKLHRALPGVVGDRFDVVIIDTPPLDEEAGIVYGALRAADAVVIPTAPSTMERDRLPAVWETLKKIQDDRDDEMTCAVLMTRINKSANSSTIIAEALKRNGHLVFDTAIPRREALALAKGFPITELYGYDSVADELDSLMKGKI